MAGKTSIYNAADTMYFFYDQDGAPYALMYNNVTYYYILNVQGDVIRLVDSNGTTVASYIYDPYGNTVYAGGEMAQKNPLRYRGYYYDQETGFYYLNARYYDPKIGRFLNADAEIAGIDGNVLGYNLFVYCMNNPVNKSDPNGNWPRWITASVSVGASVVGIVAVAVSAPAVAVTAASIALVSSVAYVAQSHHYDKRKEKNVNLPQTRQEADAMGWLGPDTEPSSPAADCHQYTSKGKKNVKYVSPDGHREVIFDESGNIVLDSRDIGTYNFSPAGTFWGNMGHFFADIVPWAIFGNDDDDPGPVLNEIIRLYE